MAVCLTSLPGYLHHLCMRTTLALEPDAMEAIRAYAHEHKVSLAKAASELIRRGTRYQLGTRLLNGLPVFGGNQRPGT